MSLNRRGEVGSTVRFYDLLRERAGGIRLPTPPQTPLWAVQDWLGKERIIQAQSRTLKCNLENGLADEVLAHNQADLSLGCHALIKCHDLTAVAFRHSEQPGIRPDFW